MLQRLGTLSLGILLTAVAWTAGGVDPAPGPHAIAHAQALPRVGEFLAQTHHHDDRYFTEDESEARYLGRTDTAADADRLDGLDSADFAAAGHDHPGHLTQSAADARYVQALPARAVGRCTSDITLTDPGSLLDLTNCGSVTLTTVKPGSHVRVSGDVGYMAGIATWWQTGVRIDGTAYPCTWDSAGSNAALGYDCIPPVTLAAGPHTVSLMLNTFSSPSLTLYAGAHQSAGGWLAEEIFA